MGTASPGLSEKQELSIAHANSWLNCWEGSVRSGKTISSLLRWLMYVHTAPRGGDLVVIGKTFDTVARNVFGPLTDPSLFGDAAKTVKYTRGASVASILGRRIEVITANDKKSEGRLRGLTGAGAYVDEWTLIPQEFFKRLVDRQSVPGAQIFTTTNPDNPGHWVRKEWLDKADELGIRRWHFVMEDNPSLDEAYRERMRRSFTGLWYRRYILGQWVQSEGAIYESFDTERHVVKTLPRIERWLCDAIDYGTTNPYADVLLGLGADRRLYVVSEYRWDSRAQRRKMTDTEYSKARRQWLARVPHPESNVVGVQPEWTIVDPSASSYIEQLHRDGVTGVTAADNSVLDGIRTVSSLFSTGDLLVHESARGLIDELPGYSWDDKAAEKGEDKPIKENDHSCFVAGTAVLTADGERPIETVRPGDRVLTRQGWKPVLDAGMTAAHAQVYQVELSNGRTLTGTGNHPIWVAGEGWVRMDALRYGDTMETWENVSTSSSSTASSSVATPTPREPLTAGTTSQASPTASAASDAYTKRSGKRPTGATFPRGTTSTTPTGTTSTTTRPTSCASPPMSTGRTTGSSLGAWRNGSILRPSGLWLPGGTAPQRVSPGTPNTVPARGLTDSRTSGPASSAAARTTPGPRRATNGSVPTVASRLGGERLESTTRTDPASSAGASSASTSTSPLGTAGVRVLRVTAMPGSVPVWNLTVADCPEYFAEGVAVHNCDALRYGVRTTEALWRPYLPTRLEVAA